MFRPCIDLHKGKVKQIVGSTLSDTGDPDVNFESDQSPRHFAEMYQRDGLSGAHVIMLGPGNEEAALDAIAGFPGGLQVGGGITSDNANTYIDYGASHIIVTSYVFRKGHIDWERLREMQEAVGKDRLVLDLSCRKRDGDYFVVTDRWQNFTDEKVDGALLEKLGPECDEFLVHAVDVEGKKQGIDDALVRLLGEASPIPATYAGGATEADDLERVFEMGRGRVNLTIGSALDIFGGSIPYQRVVEIHRRLVGAS